MREWFCDFKKKATWNSESLPLPNTSKNPKKRHGPCKTYTPLQVFRPNKLFTSSSDSLVALRGCSGSAVALLFGGICCSDPMSSRLLL